MKREGRWQEWTYAEYLERVRGVAKGFLALGLGRQRGVGIMGLNTPETVFSVFGSVFAGGLSAGMQLIIRDSSKYVPYRVYVLQEYIRPTAPTRCPTWRTTPRSTCCSSRTRRCWRPSWPGRGRAKPFHLSKRSF